MRVLRFFGFLFALSAFSTPAYAQPTLYVCTPTSQVLQIDGTSGATSVLYTHSSAGAFHDCVVGPDGQVYIAASTGIFRFDPANPPPDGGADPVTGGTLPFTPRGLAFNVATLYITGDSDVYQLVDTLSGDDELTFPAAPTPLNLGIGSPGRGIVFDYTGGMIVASASKLQRSAPLAPPASPLYTSVTPLIAEGIQPVGVAVNTCKQVLYADAPTRSIRQVGLSTPVAQFGSKDIPQYIKIASDNTAYAVTNDSSTGAATIWKVVFGFADSGCGTATPAPLVALKSKLSGPGKVDGLLSGLATGIAVEATHYSIANTFTTSTCENAYNFGLHKVLVKFQNCAVFENNPVVITIEALKSTLEQVSFDNLGPFPGTGIQPQEPIEGMRYSATGGFPIQYRYTLTSGSNPFPTPFQSIFIFETQEHLASPGVARTAVNLIDASYPENVGDDYWTGSIDPAGARGDDISKRVVFNSGTAQTCTPSPGEPFATGNPLFKQNQSVNMKLSVRTASGSPCNGGLIRVSIYRDNGDGTVTFMDVRSAANSQTMNYMSNTGSGSYSFNLDTAITSTPYVPGNYVATFSGNLFAPFTLNFSITQ